MLRTDDGFALRLHHVHDDGDADFLDVHEFQQVDEDEDFGEGRVVGWYPDAETVLEAAVVMGVRPVRWVNAGVIQDEYAALREATQLARATGERTAHVRAFLAYSGVADPRPGLCEPV